MAIEKRSIEATLESKKERIIELEAIVADLQKAPESPALPSDAAVPSTPEVATSSLQRSVDEAGDTTFVTELNELRKKISDMVSSFCNIDGRNADAEIVLFLEFGQRAVGKVGPGERITHPGAWDSCR